MMKLLGKERSDDHPSGAVAHRHGAPHIPMVCNLHAPPRASPRRSGGACGVGDKRDALFPAVEKKDDLR